MLASSLRRWLLVHVLAASAVMAGWPAAATAQVVDAPRVEQLKANIRAELLRVDAQPFEGSPRIRAALEELRDEVGFLLVARRRGYPVADEDCHAIEIRLQQLRDELRRADAWPSGDEATTRADLEVSLGAELDVALTRPISSRVARLEDRVEATTIADLPGRGRVLVPAGSLLSGLVAQVGRAWRPDARGSLTVVFDRITVDGRTYAIDTTVTDAVDADIRGEIANLALDARSTVRAAEGREVELPVGSVLRVRFQSPLELTTR